MRARCLFVCLVLGGALLVPLTGGCSRTQEKTPVLADPDAAKDFPPRATFKKPGGGAPSGGGSTVATPP
jgi:hypothetical protein